MKGRLITGVRPGHATPLSSLPSAEPVFRPGIDTMRYQDDFTKYTSAVEMWNDRNDGTMRFGQSDGSGTPADQDPNGILLLSPGRDGVTGQMMRFVYQGNLLTEEVHEMWLRQMPTLPDPTIHVFQHWARVNMSVPLNDGGAGSDIGLKWFMAWHRADGVDAQFRNQWNTHNYQPGPLPPQPPVKSCMWENYDTAATANQAHQPIGPWGTDIFNSGTWHRFTYRYKPNTVPGAPSSRDGFSQMWVDGSKIIDVSRDAVGVIPPGGWKSWCEYDDLDALGSTTVNFIKTPGNLTNNSGNPFTIDWTEFSWWTEPTP